MKKFYTLLAVVMVAFAAKAGLYMSGQFNGWSHCQAQYEFKESATAGVYTVNVEKLFGEFLICSGTTGSPNWDELRYGSTGGSVQEGVPYNVAENGTSNFNMSGTVNNVTVTLDTNKKTLLVSGQHQDNSFTVVYLVGDINGGGWKEDIETYPLESKGNNKYEGNIEITSQSWVKPRCGNQVLSASGSDLTPEMGETYTLGAGDKAVILMPGKYTVTVVADQKAESCSFTVVSEGEPGPGPQPSGLKLYTGTNDDDWATEELDAEGSVTLVVETERFFTFTTGTGWDGAWRPAEPNDGDDCVISEDGTVKANTTASNGCFKITTPGTYILTPDAATTSFTVTGFQGEVVYPETLYMIGYVNGMSFVHNTPGVASKAGKDGVYTWEGVTIGDPNAGTVDGDVFGYFNIATVVSETAPDWDSVINSGNRYGAPTKDAPLAPGTPAAVKIYKPEVDASSCESWKIAGNKTYDFTLDIPNLKISAVENTTGITDVEVENVAPVYYNLQGVRVMEPHNGIFIEVRGNKALKVVK